MQASSCLFADESPCHICPYFYHSELFPSQGGKILTGGSVIESEGNFVQPTIVEITPDAPVVKEELFGPVLYVMKFQVSCVYNLGFPF